MLNKVSYTMLLGLLVIAALAPSCRAKQAATDSRRTDSVYVREVQTVKVDTITIPADSAAIQALVVCPEGLPTLIYKRDTVKVATASHGRATATISLLGNTLLAKSNCDSLQRLVFSLNKELLSYRLKEASTKTNTVVTQRYIPQWVWWMVFLNIVGALYYLIKVALVIINKAKALPF